MKSEIYQKIYWLIIDNDRACKYDDVEGSILTCGKIQGLLMALEAMGSVVIADDSFMQNGCDCFKHLCVDDKVLFNRGSLVGLVNAI